MTDKKYIICDKAETAALLDFAQLTDALEQASQEYTQGQISSPERMVVPMALGGVMLSMPAVSEDLAIHKLVNVQPKNRELNLPTIHGHVSVYDAETGSPLFILDGPEVTGRRTAAVTMLVMRTFKASLPKEILIIGTGMQATYHLQAIQALYPDSKVWMRGINAADAQQFCTNNRGVHANLHPCADEEVPEAVDVIITLTTSTVPVYNQSGQAGRLVVGVGAFKPEMAEIGKNTLFSSDIYIDDPAGAMHEAGDLIQAGVDWSQTRSLASAFTEKPDLTRPIVFKSVGTGAWDLAACRVARAKLGL
ncbi:bifunctional Delta(1)-pyrroline-2-carboxylate/Delta(1)-piperideine-2-carboxylate reductase [Pseudomonas vranovensis]|uniref:bifunctional Delta(1)-pyrroline-2-carboxylate/Delta(1)-piperideine-2- carboxylate reductase n=1 Tax=Pseudomonas vranovensis TaxID=321661 RepID=UPI003D9858C4